MSRRQQRLAVLLATDAGESRWREVRQRAGRRYQLAGVWRLDRGGDEEIRQRIDSGLDLVVCESAPGEEGEGGAPPGGPPFAGPLLSAAFEAGVRVLDLVAFYTAFTGRLPLDLVARTWLARRLLERSRERRWKRPFDFAAGGLLLVLSLPLQLLVALAVAIDSGRPVLFRQQRLGCFKEPFTLYKFRTMVADAEADGPRWAVADDPRTTRLGRWLRRHHLDELPQLWNVMRGHLALVGPRPIRDEFRRRLAERQPLYNLRFLHRPGLTGWSQIRGPYGSTDDEQLVKLEMDLLYLASGGWLDDFYILWRTLWAVAGGKGV